MNDRQQPVERPVPGLEPQLINVRLYEAFTPGKLELLAGYLVAPPPYDEERRDLLLLLLFNEGLKEAVRLVPPELWRAALREVYGEP